MIEVHYAKNEDELYFYATSRGSKASLRRFRAGLESVLEPIDVDTCWTFYHGVFITGVRAWLGRQQEDGLHSGASEV